MTISDTTFGVILTIIAACLGYLVVMIFNHNSRISANTETFKKIDGDFESVTTAVENNSNQHNRLFASIDKINVDLNSIQMQQEHYRQSMDGVTQVFIQFGDLKTKLELNTQALNNMTDKLNFSNANLTEVIKQLQTHDKRLDRLEFKSGITA